MWRSVRWRLHGWVDNLRRIPYGVKQCSVNAIHTQSLKIHQPLSQSRQFYSFCKQNHILIQCNLTREGTRMHTVSPYRFLCTREDSTKDRANTVSNWNIANAVTVGRIIITPVTGYWIMDGAYGYALGGLIYAGLSDQLDGVLARRFKLRTVLGSYLDPVADKLLIFTTVCSLASQGVIPIWLAALILSRDAAIISGSALLIQQKGGISRILTSSHDLENSIEPSFISKLNTTMQITLTLTAVLHAGDWEIISSSMLEAIQWGTAATTTISGASYGYSFWMQYRWK